MSGWPSRPHPASLPHLARWSADRVSSWVKDLWIRWVIIVLFSSVKLFVLFFVCGVWKHGWRKWAILVFFERWNLWGGREGLGMRKLERSIPVRARSQSIRLWLVISVQSHFNPQRFSNQSHNAWLQITNAFHFWQHSGDVWMLLFSPRSFMNAKYESSNVCMIHE